MRAFETKALGEKPDATAPDGTAVRLLASLAGGSFAHFELPAGAVSHAVTHRTVEEIWYFVAGVGQLWRRQRRNGKRRRRPARRVRSQFRSEPDFQFRADPTAPLAFVAATMPPLARARPRPSASKGRWESDRLCTLKKNPSCLQKRSALIRPQNTGRAGEAGLAQLVEQLICNQ